MGHMSNSSVPAAVREIVKSSTSEMLAGFPGPLFSFVIIGEIPASGTAGGRLSAQVL